MKGIRTGGAIAMTLLLACASAPRARSSELARCEELAVRRIPRTIDPLTNAWGWRYVFEHLRADCMAGLLR